MGKVVFEDPIHHISGKIAKKFRTIYNSWRAQHAAEHEGVEGA